MLRRHVVVAVLAAAITALAAAPAQAQLTLSSFSLTPSSTKAGGNPNQPGPDITVDSKFSTSDGDTPKDATLSLASGLAARLNGIPLCSEQAFQTNHCSDSSRVGHGYITGTAPQFGFTLSLPMDAYLIAPKGSEAARIGLIVTFFGFPVATQTAPVAIRTSPDVGIDIPLTGLPRQIDGTRVIIDGLHLTIFGTVDGAPFTRNPTSCSSATSTLSVDSYGDPGTQLVKQSAFTPTGCDTLPYAPTIAGTASKDSGDDGMGLTTTVTQQYGEADNQSVDVTLPFSASPRLSALSQACTNNDLTTCPAVGSATIDTPLLSQQLNANVVLVGHQGSIPTLAILIPQPFGIELDATPILTGNAVQALISNIPDLPISSLVINLPGGPDSLFRAGTHLCTAPQSFSADFTAWNGATASPSAAATVTGCPGQSAAAPTAPARHATTGHLPSGRGHGRLGGRPGALSYSAGAPKLTVAIGAGKQLGRLKKLAIRLPAGFRVDPHQLPHGVSVILDGHAVTAAISYVHGVLRVVLPRSGRVGIVSIAAPSLRASHVGGKLVALIRASGAGGKTKTVRLSTRPR